MRVGFLCVRYPPSGTPGGVRVFVQTLAQRLGRLGHWPVVISQETELPTPEAVECVDGVRVVRFRTTRARPGLLWQRRQFARVAARVARTEKLDVVESFADHGVISGKNLGCPLVVRLHSSERLSLTLAGERASRVTNFYERRLLRNANVLVGVSDWVARSILTTAGLAELPYQVIYNGIDVERFYPGPPRTMRPGLLLFPARLTERKGLPVLFEAMPQVMRRFEDVMLRCVGPGRDDTGYPSSVASRYLPTLPSDLRSRVEFTGPISYVRMREEYQRAELCVLPSLIEGHPLVVLEAMACEVPAVFSRDGVGPEVITDGLNGFLCDARSPQSVADTICHALERCRADGGIRRKARVTVEEKFSLNRAVAANVSMYEDAIRKARCA